MSTVDFPRYFPSALPCSWWRLDNTNLIPRSRNLVRCASISDLPSAATIWSSCKRRPRKQLLAEITLISGNICVTSWLLRSVKTSQSGTLFASVPTWSFDPGRAQPTGFGLVLGYPHSTYKRGVGLRVTWQAAVRAVDPTHLLFASRVSDANTSPGSRNPIRWVERANVTPCLIRNPMPRNALQSGTSLRSGYFSRQVFGSGSTGSILFHKRLNDRVVRYIRSSPRWPSLTACRKRLRPC